MQTEYKPQLVENFHCLLVHAFGISDDGLFRIERMKEIGCTFVGMEPDIVRFQFFSHDFIEGLEMSEKVSVAFAHQ